MNYQSAPSQQHLVTLLRRRYKRLQFRVASHLAQSVGPGASPVGLGEGAKPDAPIFLLKKKWRPEGRHFLRGELLNYLPVSFGTEKLPPDN